MFHSIWSFIIPSHIKSFFSSLLISLGVINSSFIVPETPTEMREIIAYDDSDYESNSFILKEDGTIEKINNNKTDSPKNILSDERLALVKEINQNYYNFNTEKINNQLNFSKDMNFLYEFENSNNNDEPIKRDKEKTIYKYQESLSENQKKINNQYNNFIANISTKAFLLFPKESMSLYSSIHDDFLKPSKISFVKITPSNKKNENIQFYQGDTIAFFSPDKDSEKYHYSTCTLGYVDTEKNIAYTAKHCGEDGQNVYKRGVNNQFTKIGTFDKSIKNNADDSAIITLRDDVVFDPEEEYNQYSNSKYAKIDDIEKGDTVCRYGARTREVMCGEIIDINKNNLVFVADSKLFSLRGDSGGPFWIPEKGYIGILYGKIFIGNRVNVLGSIMTPEIVEPASKQPSSQKEIPDNIQIEFLD